MENSKNYNNSNNQEPPDKIKYNNSFITSPIKISNIFVDYLINKVKII